MENSLVSFVNMLKSWALLPAIERWEMHFCVQALRQFKHLTQHSHRWNIHWLGLGIGTQYLLQKNPSTKYYRNFSSQMMFAFDYFLYRDLEKINISVFSRSQSLQLFLDLMWHDFGPLPYCWYQNHFEVTGIGTGFIIFLNDSRSCSLISMKSLFTFLYYT